MKSPCVKVCKINPHTFQCEGCGRTLEQIRLWTSYTDKEREDIMKKLERNS